MHAWPPYMKQNDSKINIVSKFVANLQAGVQIRCMHGHRNYNKQRERNVIKSTMHHNFVANLQPGV